MCHLDADTNARHLHVRREARERYGLAPGAFGASGRLVEIDFAEAERIAAALTADAVVGATAGTVAAAVLLHELAHLLIAAHPREAETVTSTLQQREPKGLAHGLLVSFLSEFPPPSVASAAETADAYVGARFAAAWEELLLLSLAERNPALRPLARLFELGELRADARLSQVVAAIETALAGTGAPGEPGRAGGLNLLSLLTAPQLEHPDSLTEQLRTAMRLWGPLLSGDLAALWRLVERALTTLGEEARYLEARRSGPPHAGPTAPTWGHAAGELFGPEAFSPDREWMRRTVMVAKNAYVWLAQLSRRHGRQVTRLDQVPDAALDDVAADGMNALWLIGIWQRSSASRTIKRLRGQPDAEASAYAVDDYVVAADLGGEAALESLRRRAAARGIRLASDMVPNHTGIDGRWVIEHPERFVQLPHPPYGGYTFSGPDVSGDARVEIRIEDGYYDGSDAAVVFERRDPDTGERRYVYHGNDGTAMPWNDTAQIDFLDPAVREAVIQQVLEVCRAFPIVRFDAAMTLAKRHVRRLWHPPPGALDGVPSRSRYAASEAEFEAAMPREFWREVVERAASEAPDTLLLAEAFWMLEGYFVRELGMHRVYNSAFMHMLATEDNRRYRGILADTLASDPRVLERFVNYLSNPDEEPAAAMFGKTDKALAATVLLATMPGLPLFAHGQVEGLGEKYGMEFRQPRLDEGIDEAHRDHHRRVVAPLLGRRELFASALGFALYDAVALGDGRVVDDVFAYSNGHGGELVLVVVNNSPRHAGVRVDRGVRGRLPHSPGGPGTRTTRLFDELVSAVGDAVAGATFSSDARMVARDAVSGVDVAAPLADVAASGLTFELRPYQAVVLLATRVATDAGPAAPELPHVAAPAGERRQRRRETRLRANSATPVRAAAARMRRARAAR